VTLAAALAAILPGLRTSHAGQALPLRQSGALTLPGGGTRVMVWALDLDLDGAVAAGGADDLRIDQPVRSSIRRLTARGLRPAPR